MSPSFNLERFVSAQAPEYDEVLFELRAGRKTSHWMWFIFPQLKGLGQSEMSQHFGIASLEEAEPISPTPFWAPVFSNAPKP